MIEIQNSQNIVSPSWILGEVCSKLPSPSACVGWTHEVLIKNPKSFICGTPNLHFSFLTLSPTVQNCWRTFHYVLQVPIQRLQPPTNTSLKYGMIPRIPLRRVSIRSWKMLGVTLTPNCSLFTLNTPQWMTIVWASAVASSRGNCWYAWARLSFVSRKLVWDWLHENLDGNRHSKVCWKTHPIQSKRAWTE